jgi:hypothetical protein
MSTIALEVGAQQFVGSPYESRLLLIFCVHLLQFLRVQEVLPQLGVEVALERELVDLLS